MLNDSDLEKIRSVTREEIKTQLKIELKPIKRDLRKINGDINTVINVFDRDIITLRKRVDRVEDQMGLSPLPQ